MMVKFLFILEYSDIYLFKRVMPGSSSNNSHYWIGWFHRLQGVRPFQAARFDAIFDNNRSHSFFHRLSPYIASLPVRSKSFLNIPL